MGPTSPPSYSTSSHSPSPPTWWPWQRFLPVLRRRTDIRTCCQVSSLPPSLLPPLFLPHSQLFGMTRISSSDAPTRVSLFLKFGVANSDYINANFIRVGKYDTQHWYFYIHIVYDAILDLFHRNKLLHVAMAILVFIFTIHKKLNFRVECA